MSLKGLRILVTGGLGFIGSNLARTLVDRGCQVTLVDSLIPAYGGRLENVADFADRVSVNVSDVRDIHSLRYLVQGQDVLFNLAGQTSHIDSMTDPFTDLDINCRSQLAILEACREHNPGIRIVFAGTRQIYGRPQYLPVDERHPVVPVDVNGINKAAGEWYHLLYAQVYGLTATVLRLTNTFGPRMRVRDARQTFLGYWFRLLIEGKTLPIYGDGTQRRDLNYVDDVVEALILAATREEAKGKTYNLGGSEIVSLRELAEILVDVNGAGDWELVPFPKDREAIDIGDYFGTYDLIKSELGWEPRVGVREGVAKAIEFFRSRPDYWQNSL
jgi:UDP-glucose 4-epimerase